MPPTTPHPRRQRSLRLLFGLGALSAALALRVVAPGFGDGHAFRLFDTPTVAADAAGCKVFPADNAWNQRIDTLPVHPDSAAWVSSIGETERLRAVFSATDGIPYQTVAGSTAAASIEIDKASESDPGPYRVPDDAAIDADDGRLIVVDRDRCVLAELRGAQKTGSASWKASAGALFDLGSNDLRPDGWGSADTAGLPVFPGLARFEEVEHGEITHALRFTAPRIGQSHLWPARHGGPDGSDPELPPAGARFRLRATVNPAAYSPRAQVILVALQRYGMFLAEPGPAWGLSGAPHPGWDEGVLAELEDVFGASFEAVDVSSLVIDGGSGQAIPAPTMTPTGTLPATNTPSPTGTPPPTTTQAPTATITPTTTPEPTETPAPTRTPRPTRTPEPTETPAPTATNTLTPAPTGTFTPVPTGTPVPTNTPTPVPTVNPMCLPRPSLAVLTQPVSGQNGRLKVTIETTNSVGVPDNSLHALRIVTLSNASIEVQGDTYRSAGPTVEIDEGSESLHFYVQRVQNSQAFSATLGIVDDCGEWQTFVGGGAGLP
ncbi:MAG: hypothetical protein IT306_20780 [Chloroflexi bacterium]|nr:hypothetical protein [Chloroflexota bacterium]